jgi:hypothetical protein
MAPVALAAAIATAPVLAGTGPTSALPQWTGGESLSGPIAETANSSSPSNWRLTAGQTFNGVAGAFDGTALLLFTSSQLSGTYACSGSLMQGGMYVLTAAHCVDGLLSMTIQFGYTNNVALQTRTAVSAVQAPGWDGTLDTGADMALVKLNAPVTNLPTYKLSTTNDVGKQILITGYGTSGTGAGNSSPNWNDGNYGHYAYNTIDTTSDQFEAAWDATTGEGVYTAPTYGHTYVSDFDFYNGTSTQNTQYNTLQRIATATGGAWTSGTSLGATEGLIAGGDSGGGDFVWDGTQWVLTGVHSWGWQFCQGRFGSNTAGGGSTCDYKTNNSSSYGDLSGSTAVYDHVAWINSVIAVPEPGTYGLMALGLAVIGVAARRRRAD